MYQLIEITTAAQPTYVGYLIFIGSLIIGAAILWKMSRFDARRPV